MGIEIAVNGGNATRGGVCDRRMCAL